MTQPVQQPVVSRGSLNIRSIISLIETIGAGLAAVLYILNTHDDRRAAIISALIAFTAHSTNHPAGGSPV